MKGVESLGSVSIDIYRKEKEFRQLTLSDENVVKYLILYRSSVDITYNVGLNIDINTAGDMFEFNQELIALYLSLDNIIKKCKFKEKQSKLLELIFEGNSIHDIIEMKIDFTRSATYELFDRMVKKIVKANYNDWEECIKKEYNLRKFGE